MPAIAGRLVSRWERSGFYYTVTMNFSMPQTFPQDAFQEFSKLVSASFPTLLSKEDREDPFQKRLQFVRAWTAVRYRYRACWESNEQFKALYANASELWREWNADEEHKLERCLYAFFTNGLSVFESFGLCLYFVGSTLRPEHFRFVAEPREISLRSAGDAFRAAFPGSAISDQVRGLPQDAEFRKLEDIRNVLAHRISGRRSVRGYDAFQSDGTAEHKREEVWYVPGLDELTYDDQLVQRPLDGITSALTTLVNTSLDFVRTATPLRVGP